MQAGLGVIWAGTIVTVLMGHAPLTPTCAELRRGDSSMSEQERAGGGETGRAVARAGHRIVLGPGRIDVTLTPVGGIAQLAKHLDALPPHAKVTLALRELSSDEAPGTQFRVYLELAEGRAPTDETDPHEIGRFALFNEVRAGREEAPTSSRTYDVTATVRTLQALGLFKDPVTISIVPQRPPAPNAKAVIGEIELLIR